MANTLLLNGRFNMVKSKAAADYIKNISNILINLGQRYGLVHVFQDFIACCAIAISNASERTHYDAREKEFLRIQGQYSDEEYRQFPEMFAQLTFAMDQCVSCGHLEELLGQMFHNLNLHNEYNGQFFTPIQIADFMGMVTFQDNIVDIVKEKGFVTMCEPTCGSGAMVLGAANAIMRMDEIDFRNNMVVTATDIDVMCVYMTYIQLSLYGIPAIVIHGNTLTVEEWGRWYTPAYIWNDWVWRAPCGNKNVRYPEDETIKCVSQPFYGLLRQMECDHANNKTIIPTELQENPLSASSYSIVSSAEGQFSLFNEF